MFAFKIPSANKFVKVLRILRANPSFSHFPPVPFTRMPYNHAIDESIYLDDDDDEVTISKSNNIPNKKEKDFKNTIRSQDKSSIIKLNQPFKYHHLTVGPKNYLELNTADAKLYYTQMIALRKAEKLLQLKNTLENDETETVNNKVSLNKRNSIFEREASIIGIRAALRSNDNLISNKRSFGSVELLEILAELTANYAVGSPSARWKNGCLNHFIQQPIFFNISGHLTSQVPTSIGLALGFKLRKKTGVCLAVYGDEVAEQGCIHESFNIAALHKLPCVFVCENNANASCPSIDKSFYKRSNFIPGFLVNGRDFCAVYNATKFAAEYAQKEGPILMEIVTHAQKEYSSTPTTNADIMYMDYQQKLNLNVDPIKSFQHICLEHNIMDEHDIDECDAIVNEELFKVMQRIKCNKASKKRIKKAEQYCACVEFKILSDFKYIQTLRQESL